MKPEIFEEIEKMTDDEKKALLETQFPEELEKEAAAELDTTLLAEALYNYGWLQAQRSLAEADGLDKVAAEDLAAHEKAEKEVGEQIEACLGALGTHVKDDEIELHKEAQVAAALIFDGFSDCIEAACMDKEAAVAAAMKGALRKMVAGGKRMGRKAVSMGKAGLRRGMGMLKKHRGKAALVGGAAGGALAHKAMSKSSSAMTADELTDLVLEKQAAAEVIAEGIDKLAAKGEKKAKKLHEMSSKSSKSSKSSPSSKASC